MSAVTVKEEAITQPTSNPPGGGSWKWTSSGWQENNTVDKTNELQPELQPESDQAQETPESQEPPAST